MIFDGIDIITDFLESDCAYIHGLTALTEYNIISRPTIEMAEDYLDQGWRRFGKMFFRPSCVNCSRCIPLRLDLNKFKPSRSMRKSLSKNEGVTVEIGKPECDREHIELHNIYHQYKTKTKYWPAHNISLTEYRMLFCEPMPFAKEIRYRNKDGELIGVGYIDVLPSAHSSLYFFYNPSWAQQSPGIFSIMTEINYARELGAKYYHLGYYVKDCPSMDYKLRFTPHDLLQGKDTFWNWDETEWEIDHF